MDIDVIVDHAAIATLLRSPAGPVGVYMAAGGSAVAAAAKPLARVDTGLMRASVGWQVGADGTGVYVDVFDSARSPRGFPYPVIYAGEFLEPAVSAWPR